ncbi:MAG: T9SS type A sorting domain-containing protein [Bacteroidetes bacterium]|nr:T9SS type A sorting domain-containing protein [Bacteroidota bacterium]
MKRNLSLIALCSLAVQVAFAQLPDGSTAPNWTMNDILNQPHTLYNYLDQNKVVFLDFSATWCGPCWNYHNTGSLENLYTLYGPAPGTNNVRVFMIEDDPATNTACLYGPAGCVGGTQGNWVAGTPYPIIDDASQSNAYNINYYPTIYCVCPDRKIYETGQVGTNSLWNYAKFCSAPTLTVTSVTDVACYGGSNGAINIGVTGGMPPFTFLWSNGATTEDISNLTAGNYSLTVTGSLGGTKTLGPVVVSQPAAPVQITVNEVVDEGCGGLGGSIDVSAYGGTPGYDYLWSNGGTTPLISDLSAGSYSLTVTDDHSCTKTLLNVIVDPPTLPVAFATAPSTLTCTNPLMTLSGAGSSTGPDMNYVWSTSNGHIVSGATTLNNCVVDEAGSYELFVYNTSNNCAAYANATVTANQVEPMAIAGPPGTLTCTASQIQLAGVGSTGNNFSILWTTQGGNIVSGATTLNPTVNAGGTYTLTITNTTNGCTQASSTTVTSNTAPPNVTANGGQITCTNSTVQLSGNSTTPGVTYAWTGPNGYTSTAQNPVVSAQGTYFLTVTKSSNGCTATDDAEVTQNTTAPQASAQGGTINCTNASVTLNGSSGTPGVTYAWTGPNGYTSPAQNPVVNTQGNYVLTVTAPNGCTQTATGIVNQNTTPPTASAGPNGLLNCNASEVLLNGTASSSGNQYSYLWTTTGGHIVSGGTTLTPTVDEAGSYSLTVSNSNNGCTSTASTQVMESAPVTVGIASQTNVLCNGNSTGTATVLAGGGSGSFTYAWSNGATTSTVSALSAGSYSVTATDGEGCDETATVIITEPSEVSVNAATVAQSAPGVNDGIASANPTGGAGNYSYQWSNGETTQTISNLVPGNYTVSVTDGNGCLKMQTITVNEFGCAVSASAEGYDASCHGASDGAASIILTNAASPQVFLWSNGATFPNISGLAPGAYTVSATDGNGCEVVASVEVGEPGVLFANTTATGVTASGVDDGTATANPTGGTGPFTYLWSNGGTTQTITGLVSANYTVSVTDANGCEAAQTVPVAPFACAMLATITANDISCAGAGDGQATVTLSGGLSPFSYDWSNDETTATITNLGPGTYSVTVGDAVNCPAIVEVTILEPVTLDVELSEFANTDCGTANGLATALAMGGTPNPDYHFTWSNGETTASITGLDAGTYTVSVSDANDCLATLEVEISVNDAEAPVVATQDLTIALNASGLASLTASQIDNGSTDNCDIASMAIDFNSFTCNDLGTHEVTLTVTDVAGNSSTGTANITVVDNTLPTIIVEDLVVSLDANGTATITPQMLNNGSADNCGIVEMTVDVSTFTCDDLGANAVVLTVKDASGNAASGTAIVTIQDNIAPAITCPDNAVLPYCDPVTEFEIPTNDNCAQALVPSQTSGLPSGSSFPAGVTVMTFEVNDGNGNHNTCSFTIEVPMEMTVGLNADHVSCFGETDGSIVAQVSGGAGGYTYVWSNGAATASIENLGAGSYSVSVTDEAGCEEVQTANIAEPTAIVSTPDNITPETTGQQNGAIEVTVTGGTQPYDYEWTDENGNVISNQEDVSGLSAGNYTLKIKDDNGCISLHVFTIQSVSGIAQRKLEQSISLFPNPTSGFVTVAFEDANATEANIRVFDITGKLAADFPNASLLSGRFQMDVSGHADGIYLVRIMIENQVVTKRLVVNR